MAEEIWKDVVGFENYYQVSSFGRVRSKDRVVQYVKHYATGDVHVTHRFLGKILSLGNSDSYQSVLLSVDGHSTTHLVHRLVAIAFIPNPENKPEVNHKDGDKHHNYADNLEWATGHENQQHALSMGLHSRSTGKSKCSKIPVICVETGDVFPSMSAAEVWLGCPPGKVSGAIIANQKVREYTFMKYIA